VNAVEAESLVVRFSALLAVDDVSLAKERERFTGIGQLVFAAAATRAYPKAIL
jgi:hypothetical protein